MKKLMIALTAVATAFGLYADAVTHQDTGFISGTSFEPSEDGTSGDITQSYWVPPTGGGLTIVDKSAGKPTTSNRPLQYLAVADTKELAVKTTLGDAATLKCTLDGSGKFPIPADGLYFDGLVNFTVFDKDDEVPAADLENAKLGVYLQLKGEDESAGTNFVVAAKSTAAQEDGKFVCSIEGVDLAGWHRLTIKAIADIGDDGHNVGFVVFVDGEKAECTGAKLTTTLSPEAAEYNEAGALFVSLVKDANITSVSFDGQGSVDDLVFTTQAPEFAASSKFITVTPGEGVTSFKYDNVTYTAAAALKLAKDATSLTVTDIVYTDNKYGPPTKEFKLDGGANQDLNPTGNAAASFAGTGYETVALAVTEANNAEADGTLKLYSVPGMIALNNVNDKVITLDLNGQALNMPVSVQGGSVVIDDSAATAGSVGTLASVAGTTVTIKDGFFGNVNVLGTLVIPSDSTAEFFTFTDGPDSYAAINNVNDLKKLALVVNAGYDTTGKTFKQTETIDMTSAGTFPGIGVYNNGLGSAAAFKGVYDGNNQTISNVTIAPAKYQGLFAQVEGGTVKNLTVDKVTFDWEANYVTEIKETTDTKKNPPVTTYATEFVDQVGGAMCVGCLVDGTVENVTTKGSFGSFEAPLTASAGGVVNRICAVKDAVNVTSCTNEAAMYTAGAKAAGVVIIYQKNGDHTGTVTLTDCVNKGAINFVDKGFRMVVKETGVKTDLCDTAGGYAGVIAHTVAITINNCSNEGTITVAEKAITDGACIGQIVGHACAASTATGCSGLKTTLAYDNGAENNKVAGLDFATVADAVATYVAAPTLGGSFLVTSDQAAYEFTAAGTITFDNSLVPTFEPTADEEQFILTHEGNVWTCSVKPTTYDITITTPQNGTLETSVTNGVAADTSVKVTATPAAGYELDELTVKIMPGAFPVTVGQDGTFTMPEGNVTVLATFKAIAVTSIDVAVDGEAAAEVDVKKTLQLKATVNPTTALTQDVTWTSADATIATVDQTGLVTGVAAGTVKIIATATDGSEVKGELEITVKAAGPVYPQDLPDDPTVKAKYDAWAAGKTIENPDAPVVMEAFLLNCDLDQVAAAKANFKITSITQDAEGNWIVKVTDEKGEGDEYGNGYVEIVPYEGIDVGDNGELFQAKLVLQPLD